MKEMECVCPGDTLTFQCTVIGKGSTVWQGSAFYCSESGGGLILRHHQFANGTLHKYCDGENVYVVARTIGVTDNSYISELSLIVSLEMTNKTVECVHDNGTHVNIVDTTAVSITTGKCCIRLVIIFHWVLIYIYSLRALSTTQQCSPC